jgi:hypothetical protein
MLRSMSIAALVTVLSAQVLAQQTDSTLVPAPPEQPKATNVFYGGTVGVGFGNPFRLSFQPFVGMVFTPKISGGLKVGYEYIRQENYGTTTTWHNYGASVFGRYRLIPRAYLHTEFAYYSYGYKVSELVEDRYWVPFLLVGGGYLQPISPSASAFVEVLFDVLQDSKSPYEAWTPWVSFGVAVGF